MYEVAPDDDGLWILYRVGGGNFDVVAWFATRDDAEFAKRAFEASEPVGLGGCANDRPLAIGGSREVQ
jgi:hypothetical protein